MLRASWDIDNASNYPSASLFLSHHGVGGENELNAVWTLWLPSSRWRWCISAYWCALDLAGKMGSITREAAGALETLLPNPLPSKQDKPLRFGEGGGEDQQDGEGWSVSAEDTAKPKGREEQLCGRSL